VLFISDASDLVGNDDTNGSIDIFRKNLTSGFVERVSTASDGSQANGRSSHFGLSADGRYLVFDSNATNLISRDTNAVQDIFLKDLVKGVVTRMSVSTDGVEANGPSYNPQVSRDGRYVVFESDASNLVEGDTNGRSDVFCKDMLTGEIVCLSKPGNSLEAFRYAGQAQISPDGRYIVFESNVDNLVSGDTNGDLDVFRVDLLYQANAAAIAQGRFIEVKLGTGAASSAAIAWGDGTSSTVAPSAGSAAFSHAYASAGAKAATVTLVEGALTWQVAHTIDLGTGTMARNTALADTLSGGAGSDILTGDAFANILVANGGNDRLNGDAGNDLLEGGSGNDVVSAGDGNDRSVGGLGKDTFTGGQGRDVFVFDDRDTSSSKTKADYILDFKGREGDRLDLRAVDANTKKGGDQNFSFIGQKAFSKEGQVRYEKAKGYTYVYLNTDADKAAEAVIKLKGAIDLSKAWFVL